MAEEYYLTDLENNKHFKISLSYGSLSFATLTVSHVCFSFQYQSLQYIAAGVLMLKIKYILHLVVNIRPLAITVYYYMHMQSLQAVGQRDFKFQQCRQQEN